MTWLDLADPISLQEAVRSQLKRKKGVNLLLPSHLSSTTPIYSPPATTFVRISPISCAPQLSSPPTSGPPATPPPRRVSSPSLIGLVTPGRSLAERAFETADRIDFTLSSFCALGAGFRDGGRAGAASSGPIPFSLNLDGCICESYEEG